MLRWEGERASIGKLSKYLIIIGNVRKTGLRLEPFGRKGNVIRIK